MEEGELAPPAEAVEQEPRHRPGRQQELASAQNVEEARCPLVGEGGSHEGQQQDAEEDQVVARVVPREHALGLAAPRRHRVRVVHHHRCVVHVVLAQEPRRELSQHAEAVAALAKAKELLNI